MKKKLCIVGVGSAGIVSACYFCSWLDDTWEVTLIYDPNIKTLGIGESTNSGFVTTLERGLGFKLLEDMYSIDGTLKYGTEFINWRDHSWVNPLIEGTVAVHFNTNKLPEVALPKLKEKWGSKFRVIEGTVTSVTQDSNGVYITANDIPYIFNYAVDCRGFPQDFTDYTESDCSLVNHCVVYDSPELDNDLLYTEHIATKNGWMFGIPLATRKSYGYLFNSTISSKDDVLADMSDILKVELTNANTREYKFKPYKAKKYLDNRILKNGNRALFFEPISATSIYMYVRICDIFYDFLLGKYHALDVNLCIENDVSDIETIIKYYYHGGSAFDTHFWNAASSRATDQLSKNHKFYDLITKYRGMVERSSLYADTGFVFPPAALHYLDKMFEYNYFTGDEKFKFKLDEVAKSRSDAEESLMLKWNEFMSNNDSVKLFNEKGYCIVRNVIDKNTVDLVSQYALFDQQTNFAPEGPNAQIPGTHSKYGDPMMETLLLKLLPTMEQITGLQLNPTYSYYRVYKPGDELVKHVDRPSCEISCTVCFNFDYKEMNGSYEWPIWMVDSPAYLQPGDLVAYHGCDLTHWREPFTAPEGSWHVQAFLHYVDANGPYAECKYDGRPGIGMPGNTRDVNFIKSFLDQDEPVPVQVSPTSQESSTKKYIIYTK